MRSGIQLRWAACGAVLLALGVLFPLEFRIETAVNGGWSAAGALAAGEPEKASSGAQAGLQSAPNFAPLRLIQFKSEEAAGHLDQAMVAGKKLVDVEPLAQHEIRLAIVMWNAGSRDESLKMVADAVARDPPDPFVELNAAVLLARAGSRDEASSHLGKLLEIQPWLGLILDQLPRELMGVREPAVQQATMELAQSGSEEAIVLAVGSGHPELARSLLDRAERDEKALLEAFASGLNGSRTSGVEEDALEHPGGAGPLWAWVLSARQCDGAATARWARFYFLSRGVYPQVPTRIGMEPSLGNAMYPFLYQGAVWKVLYPRDPNPNGTWVYDTGTPACLP